MMKVDKFIAMAKKIATDYKTLYVMGCIGAPLTQSNYTRYTTNYPYNGTPARRAMIKAACDTTPRTFGFDCCCLIKSILWGWEGDPTAPYGGAQYKSNDVPDINEAGMINVCKNVSSDFSKITAGEVVYLPGHIGIYVGDGKVVECTPMWKNGVQFTNLSQRTWTKHGFLPYVDYSASSSKPEQTKPKPAPDLTPVKSEFLGSKGYLCQGDKGKNVEKLCKFMYDAFPGYASVLHRKKKDLLGDQFGPNLKAWVTEFQKRTGLEPDGCVGPITLAELKKYGFKE